MKIEVLTKREGCIQDCIKTSAALINPQTGKACQTLAIWDTGATDSVITKATATELGLVPISKTQVRGVGGVYVTNIYRVTICLNKNIPITCLVTECEELSDAGDTGLLIGMNIITLGDFTVTNYKGKTTMTFRFPSLVEVDYVKEMLEYQKFQKLHQLNVQKKLPDKCGCGSGKLWKNCHGQSIYAV